MKHLINHKTFSVAFLMCCCHWFTASGQSMPSSGINSYIESVKFGNDSNIQSGSSNTWIQGYSDWTSVLFHATEYSTNKIEIQYGGSHSSTSIFNNVRIWIDYNDNLTYEPNERIVFQQYPLFSSAPLSNLGSMANTMSDFISIPAGTGGIHYIRIRYMDTMTGFSPCADYTADGETEDYLIFIAPPTCVPSFPSINSHGYIDAGVSLSSNVTPINQPVTASIDFYSNSFTCGYVQWYYTIGSSYPLTYIEIPNSNSSSITFSSPVPGEFRLWATGMMGTPQTYFIARGSSVVVLPDTSTSSHAPGSLNLPDDKSYSAGDLGNGINPTNSFYSNTGATVDMGEPTPPSSGCSATDGWCNGQTISNTVWFKYFVPGNASSLKISVQGKGASPLTDSQLAVYNVNGGCGNYAHYSLLGANDDASMDDLNSSLTINGAQLPKQEYIYLQVDGKDNLTGDFTIQISCTYSSDTKNPSLDLMASAENESGQQRTADATKEITLPEFEADVFPNPFDQSITVRHQGAQTSSHYSLFDMSGKKIIENAGSNLEINTSGLANGIYFIRIESGTQVINKKIIKAGKE